MSVPANSVGGVFGDLSQGSLWIPRDRGRAARDPISGASPFQTQIVRGTADDAAENLVWWSGL